MALLELASVNTFYGRSHILFDVSLSVEKGEVVSLLGRNGAGKSTTFRSIIGLTPPRTGEVSFRGERISGLRPYQICRKGVGFVPEDRRCFPDLTVRENLEVAVRREKQRSSPWTVEKVYSLFPRLQEREKNLGSQLSGGEQQMLTIARTLMTNPDLLLLAEQNLHFCAKVADRGYVIDKGSVKYEGKMSDLLGNEEIKDKYLAV